MSRSPLLEVFDFVATDRRTPYQKKRDKVICFLFGAVSILVVSVSIALACYSAWSLWKGI